jgi:protein-S-isoprenylcysteine O-methyltransferase Ste14
MGTELAFKVIFIVLFVTLLVIRGFFGWNVRQAGHSSWSVDKDAVEREGKWSLLLRPIVFLCMLASIILYLVSPEGSSCLVVTLPGQLRWFGAGLGIVSLPLLFWVHHTLREYWSTALQLRKSHSLITSGPYRWIRHPMYSALMLCFVGLSLVSAVWPFILLVFLSILFFCRVVGREETMMIEQFGNEYRAYMKRTGRFLPRLFPHSE